MRDLDIKKRAWVVFIISLLSSASVYAQNFGFGSPRSSGTGLYNAISNVMDTIFGGIVAPIFDAISFNNFETSVKLALFIILFILLSHLLKGFLLGRNMEEKSAKKFSKVIGAIISILAVAFMPRQLLQVVFADLLGGLVGFLLIAGVVIYPLYLLYKFSKDGGQAENLTAAVGFLLLTITYPYLHDEFVFAFDFGIMQNISSLLITFGTAVAAALFVHRLVMGFRSGGGGDEAEPSSRVARPSAEEADDDFRDIKALAAETAENVEVLIEHVNQIPDHATTLANTVFQHPEILQFMRSQSFSPVYQNIRRLIHVLDSARKKKGKAKQISRQLSTEYSELQRTLSDYGHITRALHTHITHQRADPQFFSQVNKIFEHLRHDLNTLLRVLERVDSL